MACLLLFTLMMPGAVVIVPELQFFRSLGWTNNLPALGVLYAAFTVQLGCWILKSSFDTVPGEVK
jgi:ABC-type glycerol-3-phosphate transport system permease component